MKKVLIKSLFATIFAILLLEVVLQIASVTSPNLNRILVRQANVTRQMEHDLFRSVGNPEFSEHDERGFRNEHALDQADTVIIGDSHVYGTSVPSHAKWSDRLQDLTGVRTYNIAFGGFGPYKHEHNFERALTLNPKTILYGVYMGDDFFNDFDYYLRKGSADPCGEDPLCRAAFDREAREPLAKEVGYLFGQGAANTSIERHSTLRNGFYFLADHVKFLGLTRALVILLSSPASILDESFDSAVKALTPEQMRYVCPLDKNGWKTIATPAHRAKVLDYSDPRIIFGFRQSKTALQRYARISKDRMIEFRVVILPTKEYVFFERGSTDQGCGISGQLIEREEHFRALLMDFLTDQGIPVIDVAPNLSSSDAQTYFEDANGHPNSIGHEVIARTVAERIAR